MRVDIIGAYMMRQQLNDGHFFWTADRLIVACVAQAGPVQDTFLLERKRRTAANHPNSYEPRGAALEIEVRTSLDLAGRREPQLVDTWAVELPTIVSKSARNLMGTSVLVPHLAPGRGDSPRALQ